MCSLPSPAVSTLTRNRSKLEEWWALLPFPTRLWVSSSYGFPLLPIIYHWGQGEYFLSSLLLLWSLARWLLGCRMAQSCCQFPPRSPAPSSKALAPAGGSPRMMDLKGQTEWTSPLLSQQFKEGKELNIAWDHTLLWISLLTCLSLQRALCSVPCVSSNLAPSVFT